MGKAWDLDSVLVVDFGGQYAHLIARRIRELGVYSEIVPAVNLDAVGDAVSRSAGVILSGGPGSVWESRHDEAALMAIESGKPVLGICYGHQLLAKVLGGEVGRSPLPEFGPTEVEVLDHGLLLDGLPAKFKVWMSHYDAVLRPPRGAKVLARSPGSPVAAMELGSRVFGVQWHPEVRHSQFGMELLDTSFQLLESPGAGDQGIWCLSLWRVSGCRSRCTCCSCG